MKPVQIENEDRRLLLQLEPGLPLVPRPYAEVGAALGMTEDEVLSRLGRLIASGVIRRFGVVVRHHEVGYKANAMVVWDVPDDRLATAASHLSAKPCVTLCYQRPRRLPEWPYNLFSMIHGTSEATVRQQIAALGEESPLVEIDHDVLFSRRRFKQKGAHYGPCRPSLVNREVA